MQSETPADPQQQTRSIGRAAVRAAVWAFFSTAGGKVITLVSLALLARLLAPREFGLLAFALAYMTYVEAIGDLGSGVALVYWPDRRDEAAQVTFLVNIAAGLFWFLLSVAAAPLIADFFDAPHGTNIVRVLAVGFLIKFAGNTHDALAQKDLRFRARTIPELGFAALKAVVALILAWFGFGAWSLVWGHLAGVTCKTVLLWTIVPWRPSWSYPKDLMKPMLGYGRGIIALNILAAITHHADLAVIGRAFGTTALGLYQMAGKVPEATVIVLLWVTSKVLFPAFAKVHSAGESLRKPYLVATRYISVITLPAAIGLSALSRPIVETFFGKQWLPAAPILSALAVAAAVRCISSHAGDVLKAVGKATLLAKLGVVKAVVTLSMLLAAAAFGSPVTTAWALAGSYALTTIMTLVIASGIIGVTMREIAWSFAPGVGASAAMAVTLYLYLRMAQGQPALVQLIGGVIFGAIVYLALLSLIDREIFRKVRHYFVARRDVVKAAG